MRTAYRHCSMLDKKDEKDRNANNIGDKSGR